MSMPETQPDFAAVRTTNGPDGGTGVLVTLLSAEAAAFADRHWPDWHFDVLVQSGCCRDAVLLFTADDAAEFLSAARYAGHAVESTETIGYDLEPA